jgi:uncharacterized membrane protein YkgB
MNALSNLPTTDIENVVAREVPNYPRAFGSWMEKLGSFTLRYGLVAILFYFGAYKFTAEEAQGIAPLVTHSPFFGWLQALLGAQGISDLIGSSEMLIALLIAARPFSARVSAVGSLLAVGTFLATLSFLITTPGIWHVAAGYAVPVPNLVGAFLLKDVFLFGASVWSAGEALRAAAGRR